MVFALSWAILVVVFATIELRKPGVAHQRLSALHSKIELIRKFHDSSESVEAFGAKIYGAPGELFIPHLMFGRILSPSARLLRVMRPTTRRSRPASCSLKFYME